MAERGEIRNRKYASQLRDFSGLRYGNITPTDGDLEIEYHNIAWVFGELKYKDERMSYGQELAFERKCDDMTKVKPTLLILASHEAPPDKDIDVANTRVVKYRFHGRWILPNETLITKVLIDRFFHWVETGEKLNNGNS